MFEPSAEGQWHFIFKSYADLARDVEVWCKHLPHISAVYGMPRSGLMVASLISLNLNVPLVGIKPYMSREKVIQPSASRPILVVDDSCSTGATLEEMKKITQPDMPCIFGVYLCNPPHCHKWDMVFMDTGNMNHLMEWSTLHVPFNQYTYSDLDGVICEEPPVNDETQQESYENWLPRATCIRVPTYPLRAIVTARLDKYRPQTEAWLAANGVTYETLYMSPFRSPQARGENDGLAGLKSRLYEADPQAHLFVESDPNQSEAITFRTGKPVLDWGSKRLLHYGVRVEVQANPIPLSRTTFNLPSEGNKPLESLVPLVG